MTNHAKELAEDAFWGIVAIIIAVGFTGLGFMLGYGMAVLG